VYKGSTQLDGWSDCSPECVEGEFSEVRCQKIATWIATWQTTNLWVRLYLPSLANTGRALRSPVLSYGRNEQVVFRKKLKVLLMTVMIVMVASPLFGAHEALAAVFTGTALDDTLTGTAENDTLSGLEGNDYLEGRAGDDYLYAGVGDDTIEGGRGNDRIYPDEGADEVYAGAGNDLIYARDTASRDYIDCGGGFDQVETIHRDDVTLSNCERALGPRKGNIPT
jgi:hypothetical protein